LLAWLTEKILRQCRVEIFPVHWKNFPYFFAFLFCGEEIFPYLCNYQLPAINCQSATTINFGFSASALLPCLQKTFAGRREGALQKLPFRLAQDTTMAGAAKWQWSGGETLL